MPSKRNTNTHASFTARVQAVVRGIRKGQVLSYAEVARRAGNARAARAVGSIMRKNMDPSIPCHRVIQSNGKLGEYNRGGTAEKARILSVEGFNPRNMVL